MLAEMSGDVAPAVEADGSRVLLRRRLEHTAYADVVEAVERRGLRMVARLDGEADDGVRTQEATGVSRVHVALPDMHPVRSARQRHIHAVVDEERHVGAVERGTDGTGALDHLAGRGALVAILQDRRPAPRGMESQRREIAIMGAGGIEDGVE